MTQWQITWVTGSCYFLRTMSWYDPEHAEKFLQQRTFFRRKGIFLSFFSYYTCSYVGKNQPIFNMPWYEKCRREINNKTEQSKINNGLRTEPFEKNVWEKSKYKHQRKNIPYSNVFLATKKIRTFINLFSFIFTWFKIFSK